jgi:hypothetical protein
MSKFNPVSFFKIADQTPNRIYSPLVRQYLAYLKIQLEHNVEGDVYDRFSVFLTGILGIDRMAADEEVAYFMNAVCDAMD